LSRRQIALNYYINRRPDIELLWMIDYFENISYKAKLNDQSQE